MRYTKTTLVWLLVSPLLLSLPAAAQDRAAMANRGPAWAATPIDSVPYDSILAFARSRPYDVSPWYSDRQYLVSRDRGELRVGPMARIAALLDLHLMLQASMNQGRFIGRIESEGNVEQMGLMRGTTYVWIDDHDHDGRLRALFFPDWNRPPELLRPTLDSLAVPPAPRGGRGWLIFESTVDVFPLDRGMCELDRKLGAFWMQDDPVGYDSLDRFWGDDGGLGGCYPCDCVICCAFHPIPRYLGAQFPPIPSRPPVLPPGRGWR